MDANRTATALLVDDEPVSRKAHQTRLEQEGYMVFVAQDQAEALSRARQAAPKVIFVHLIAGAPAHMPLIQALRSDDEFRHIPIIVIKDQADARMARTKLRSVPRESW
jgi:CheY-like chemotaxis protein